MPSSNGQPFWWELRSQPHEQVNSAWEHIRQQQTTRIERLLMLARLYGDRNISGFGPGEYNMLRDAAPMFAGDRLTWNLCSSAVDTLTSKMSRNKPRPMFVTSGGDPSQQSKAKNLTKFSDGQYHRVDAYAKGRTMLKDGLVFGDGILYPYVADESIHVERVFPWEIFIDDAEAIYGKPMSMFRVKFVERERLKVLAKQWSGRKHDDAIENAHRNLEGDTPESTADMVRVIEAWRLPSGPDSPGKHFLGIDNATFVYESYEEYDRFGDPCFPFVFFNWKKPLQGFHGQSLVGELLGIQLEITKLLRKIQRTFHLVANPWILAEGGVSGGRSLKFTNEIAPVIKYTGREPRVVTHASVHQEVFAHLENLWDKGFEIAGISQLSASSKKPAGVEAAIALQTLNDIETERFTELGRNYEEAFLDLTDRLIGLAKQLDKTLPGGYQMRSTDGKEMVTLNWKDVELRQDAYIMQVFPTSALPTQPSARQSRVSEMIQSGMISPEEGLNLLDFPDTEAASKLRHAAREDVMREIEGIVERNEYHPPEPFMDLKLAKQLGQSAYLVHRRQKGFPAANLSSLRRWLVAIDDLQQRTLAQEQQEAAAAQQLQAAAAGGPLPGVPDALPPQGGPPPVQ